MLLLLHFQVPRFNNVTLLPSEQVTAQEIDRYFRLELIYKRNERMGRRVKALLEEHPDKSFFFAFGAGQFSYVLEWLLSHDLPSSLHDLTSLRASGAHWFDQCINSIIDLNNQSQRFGQTQ